MLRVFPPGYKIVNRYLTDVSLRVKISLHFSLVFNLIYAAFKLISGVYYASFWYGADAIFYIVLSIARFLLIRHVRKNKNDSAAAFKQYRICGILIFGLNAAFVSAVYQIVNHQSKGYSYPGSLIYVVAIYTFYLITISVINMVKYHKQNNPVYSAQKALSLTKALVAMFALQTSMFASFGADETLERVMNIASGGVICFTIFAIAVMIIIRANQELGARNANE